MSNEAPPPIPSSRSDDDILHIISHALLYRGRKRADTEVANFGAKILAERVLEALRHGYEIRPRPPAPPVTSAQHPPMDGWRRGLSDDGRS